MGSAKESLKAAELEVSRLEGDKARYKEQVAELQNQVGRTREGRGPKVGYD